MEAGGREGGRRKAESKEKKTKMHTNDSDYPLRTKPGESREKHKGKWGYRRWDGMLSRGEEGQGVRAV